MGKITKEILPLTTYLCKQHKEVAPCCRRKQHHGDATLNRIVVIGAKRETIHLIGLDTEAGLAHLELGLLVIILWEIVCLL